MKLRDHAMVDRSDRHPEVLLSAASGRNQTTTSAPSANPKGLTAKAHRMQRGRKGIQARDSVAIYFLFLLCVLCAFAVSTLPGQSSRKNLLEETRNRAISLKDCHLAAALVPPRRATARMLARPSSTRLSLRFMKFFPVGPGALR